MSFHGRSPNVGLLVLTIRDINIGRSVEAAFTPPGDHRIIIVSLAEVVVQL